MRRRRARRDVVLGRVSLTVGRVDDHVVLLVVRPGHPVALDRHGIGGRGHVHVAGERDVTGPGDRRGPMHVDVGVVLELHRGVVDTGAAAVLGDAGGDRGAVGRCASTARDASELVQAGVSARVGTGAGPTGDGERAGRVVETGHRVDDQIAEREVLARALDRRAQRPRESRQLDPVAGDRRAVDVDEGIDPEDRDGRRDSEQTDPVVLVHRVEIDVVARGAADVDRHAGIDLDVLGVDREARVRDEVVAVNSTVSDPEAAVDRERVRTPEIVK